MIPLPDVEGFMRWRPTCSIWYLLWDRFHLLTFAEVTPRPNGFETHREETPLDAKTDAVAKNIAPKLLRRGKIAGMRVDLDAVRSTNRHQI